MNPPLYGLDVTFRTTGLPVSAGHATITAAAIAKEDKVDRFDGEESEVLWELATGLAKLAPGTVVTWNGSTLVLPLLGYRAGVHGVEFDLDLWPDRRNGSESLIAGMGGAVMAAIGAHQHLDLSRVYAEVGRFGKTDEADLPEVDDLCCHDPAIDARLLRTLASRRWSSASRLVDQPSTNWDDLRTVTTPVTEREQSALNG